MNDIASERVGPMLNPPHLGELIRESMDRSALDRQRRLLHQEPLETGRSYGDVAVD